MGYVNKTYLSTQFKNFADKIAKVFSKIGHTHLKSDITDFPTSMPANGGNAATVGGHTVGVNVPSNAKFTDTWRPVVDDLTSTATDSSLSANQGKILNDKISELSNYYQKKSYVHIVDRDGSSTLVIPFSYASTAIMTIYLNGVHLIEGVDYHIMSTGNIIFQHTLKKDTKIEFDVFQSVAITDEDWSKFQTPVDSVLSSTSENPVQNKVVGISLDLYADKNEHKTDLTFLGKPIYRKFCTIDKIYNIDKESSNAFVYHPIADNIDKVWLKEGFTYNNTNGHSQPIPFISRVDLQSYTSIQIQANKDGFIVFTVTSDATMSSYNNLSGYYIFYYTKTTD